MVEVIRGHFKELKLFVDRKERILGSYLKCCFNGGVFESSEKC